MRRLKKKPLTTNGITRILKALERLMEQGYDPNLVLNQSEDCGYTGVFPVSQNYYEQRGLKPQKVSGKMVDRMTSTDWAQDLLTH